MKTFEGCAGSGGGSFALKLAGINFECVGYSEVDPKCPKCKKITPHSIDGLKMICDVCGCIRHNYAAQCYEQNHGYNIQNPNTLEWRNQIKNYGDMTKIDPYKIPDYDLFLCGFPCQSFSVAGKGLGELDPRGTIFHDIIRINEIKKPEYMILENVKGLTNKKHKSTFDKILSELDRIGYYVKVKVLNSKDYGIPQNRERVWFICFRKDGLTMQHEWACFDFPEKEELKIFLKDILEENVDEKYYLKEEQINKLLPHQDISYCIDANYYKGTNVKGFIEKKRRQIVQVNKGAREGYRFYDPEGISPTLNASKGGITKDIGIIQLNNPKHSNDRVYSKDGVSPTLNTMQGGNRQPFIVASRGRGNPPKQKLEPKFNGTTNSITSVQKDNWLFDGRIRRLTPKECFRLMGFLDDNINLEGLSNTQQYKLAGNGWDINLVSKIFKEMFRNE